MERRRRSFAWVCVLLQSLLVVSLNDEGIVLLRFKERIEKDPFGGLLSWKEGRSLEDDHCSWFGVECVDGHVVSLNLKSLCLAGALGPELAHLVHIKSIILRNNSLFGVIPEELGTMKHLQLLDLSFNNFSGPSPLECWGNNMAMILLDNNGRFCRVPPESCVADRATALSRAFTRGLPENSLNHRRLQQTGNDQDNAALVSFPVNFPGAEAESPQPSPANPEPSDSDSVKKPPPAPPEAPPGAPPPPSPTCPASGPSNTSPAANRAAIGASVGGFILLALLVGLCFWRYKKMAAVGPWRGTLSGELQRSCQNGVPNVKRRELETACEDFSNVIGSTSMGTLYKGTLSNGAEIAVLSYTAKSSKDWSKDLQTQFSNRVEKLSKVNHKNFLNLLAYCKEERPFTRMLIFEYAPCGTLFEHLHVRESEHLDWAMRLRIMMGMAYSLEHMHNLSPWVAHESLTAYAVSLTDDYAAKLSDFSTWNEASLAAGPQPAMAHGSEPPGTRPEDNVCSFGLILLEMVTGKTPYSVETGSLDEWALQFLRGEKTLKDFVDPTLRHFHVGQLERIGEVIKSCTYHDPYNRPGITDVVLRLGKITGVAADAAAPRNCMWLPAFEFRSYHL